MDKWDKRINWFAKMFAATIIGSLFAWGAIDNVQENGFGITNILVGGIAAFSAIIAILAVVAFYFRVINRLF